MPRLHPLPFFETLLSQGGGLFQFPLMETGLCGQTVDEVHKVPLEAMQRGEMERRIWTNVLPAGNDLGVGAGVSHPR